MGSAKKEKRARRDERGDHDPVDPAVRTDRAVRTIASPPDPLADRVVELSELLRSQHDEIARMTNLVDQLVESRALVERQLERSLVLQQRTNALIELLLGSAFDLELGRVQGA
jgi:hypothetical protein